MFVNVINAWKCSMYINMVAGLLLLLTVVVVVYCTSFKL